MPKEFASTDGRPLPYFLYGTAWKENETQRLVELALQQGFRGIDTANQRKHYHEAAVGKALANSIANGLVAREGLFLQTKFTFPAGQDHRLPYDPNAPVVTQVEQSFASSLEHLGTDYVDSYLLHGPTTRTGLVQADREAWKSIERLHDDGRARAIGVSNVSLQQLELFYKDARVRPHYVQNRCYASQGWDRRVRAFCAQHSITYQGFSLLTANRAVLTHPDLTRIAARHDYSPAQIIFRFALDVGMLPLTGTTNAERMRSDLDVFNFRLDPTEIERIEALAG